MNALTFDRGTFSIPRPFFCAPRPRSFYTIFSSSTLSDQFILLTFPGREYAAADTRWGTADPTVVSLELLTVFGAAPLAAYIVYQIVKGDPTRYYWIIVLCTAELYGGYVVFYPGPRNPKHARAIKKLIYLLAGLLFSRKVDDVLSRMARRKPGSQHVERAPFLGLPCREFASLFPVDVTGLMCVLWHSS